MCRILHNYKNMPEPFRVIACTWGILYCMTLSQFIYCTLIADWSKVLCVWGTQAWSRRLLQKMIDEEVTPDVINYNSAACFKLVAHWLPCRFFASDGKVLHSLEEASQWQLSLHFLQDMSSCQATPDVVSYSVSPPKHPSPDLVRRLFPKKPCNFLELRFFASCLVCILELGHIWDVFLSLLFSHLRWPNWAELCRSTSGDHQRCHSCVSGRRLPAGGRDAKGKKGGSATGWETRCLHMFAIGCTR